MKTKIILIASFMAVFAVGFICGSAHSTAFWAKFHNQGVYQGCASDVSTYVQALSAFRHGDEQGCANILENSLESSLLAMNNGYKILATQHNNSIFETIKEARGYRAKHPWGSANAKMTPDVEQTISTGVDHVLSLGM